MVSASSRPNFLIFFTDQQRADTLGAYGCPMDLTPNLDALARRGTRFHHAFTPQPVCGPARSIIQTGLYANRTGVWANGRPFNRQCRTFAQGLGEAGYDLGYFGKWHLSHVRTTPVVAEDRLGWDGAWEAADVFEYTSRPYEGRVFDADNNPVEFKDQYRTDFLTDRAIRFLERNRGGEPFCLMVSYLEPHHQNDLHRVIAPEGYADAIRRHWRHWIPEDLRGVPGDWGAEWADYLGIVQRLDENFGQIQAALERIGALDNTIILFFTDHGCHFRTRNSEYKRSCHDASIRIPFLAAGPGFDGGGVRDEFVTLADVAPTILDAAGLDVPEGLDGRSLLPLVRNEAADWRDSVFVQISEYMTGRAVRTRRWTYCVNTPDIEGRNQPDSDVYVEYQLYDNYADPHQRVNLIGRYTHRDAADEMKALLLEHMAAAGERPCEIRDAQYYA